MTKGTLFRLICLFTISCFARKVPAQNYMPYFKAIARAEMALLDSNYHQSIAIYKEAFQSYNFVFPKDCFIAAQLAAYVKDSNTCRYFLGKGMENGLPWNEIEGNIHLHRWLNASPHHKASLSIDSLQNIYHNKIDQELRREIIAMTVEDQKLRDRVETPLNHFFFYLLKPFAQRRFDKQANEFSKKIHQLTIEHGFPSHRLIGTHDSTDYKKFGTEMGSDYATIILFHSDFAWHYLKGTLPEELQKGNISPKQYALLRDFATRHYMYGKVKDAAYADYTYFIRWTYNGKHLGKKARYRRKEQVREMEAAIDSARAKIGLPPYRYDRLKKKMTLSYEKLERTSPSIESPVFDLRFWSWD